MDESLFKPCTAFDGYRLLLSGPLVEVAFAVKNAEETGTAGPLLTFDDGTGRVIDIDTRGTKQETVARLSQAGATGPVADAPGAEAARAPSGPEPEAAATRNRGRPKLGVVAREVTLLPRHWDWLNGQPGGASVALRKLVDQARRDGGEADRQRAAVDAAYRFMAAIAGDLPGFEEASRALFASDRARFGDLVSAWPADVRAYALRLATAGTDGRA